MESLRSGNWKLGEHISCYFEREKGSCILENRRLLWKINTAQKPTGMCWKESERKLDFFHSKFGSVGNSSISFQVRIYHQSWPGPDLLYHVIRGLGCDLLQITKELRLAATSGYPSPTPSAEAGSSGSGVQVCVKLSFEYFHGWRFYNL